MLTIKKKTTELKRGCTSVESNRREEWQKTAVTPETITKCMISCESDSWGCVSEETMQNIMRKELWMRKLYAKWMLHLLNAK